MVIRLEIFSFMYHRLPAEVIVDLSSAISSSRCVLCITLQYG